MKNTTIITGSMSLLLIPIVLLWSGCKDDHGHAHGEGEHAHDQGHDHDQAGHEHDEKGHGHDDHAGHEEGHAERVYEEAEASYAKAIETANGVTASPDWSGV